MDPPPETEGDEQTPLLQNQQRSQSVTPLPKVQLGIIYLAQFAEPITSQCINPFINQLVGELDIIGGDKSKVGYYAGMIQSLFFATEAIFVLHWGMLSDRIGRKPVAMVGMAGLCISMVCFGLSKSFLSLVISRCLVGSLNGNIGVLKSAMADVTDSTNIAQAFALTSIVWSIGSTIGPFIGGTLAKPHDRWPENFPHPFWTEYPYFLPCGVSAAFSALVFVILGTSFKETLRKGSQLSPQREPSERERTVGSNDSPPSFRSVLIWPVLISVTNYGLLALLDIARVAAQPLFYASPIEYGGLGLSPAQIGTILSIIGVFNGVAQAFLFAKLIKAWGHKRLFMFTMSAYIPLFSLFPVIHLATTRLGGVTPLVWVLIGIQASLVVIAGCAYPCILIYVASSAPSRRSLGATNGLSQVIVSVARAIGPASSTSLFAFSHEYNWLGGNAVYFILVLVSGLCLFVSNMMPQEPWKHGDEE